MKVNPTHSETQALKSLQAQVDFEYQKLLSVFSDLATEELCQPGAVGEWSVKDVLAHLTAWEKRLLQRISGLPEDGVGMGTPQYNAQVYEANKDRFLEDVITEFHLTHLQVLHKLESMPEAEIDRWQQAFRLNTYNHYKWAAVNIRHWRRSQSQP